VGVRSVGAGAGRSIRQPLGSGYGGRLDPSCDAIARKCSRRRAALVLDRLRTCRMPASHAPRPANMHDETHRGARFRARWPRPDAASRTAGSRAPARSITRTAQPRSSPS
jgi:hypothetical protein